MRNIKTKKKLKVLAMVIALSIPIAAAAQGGLFQRGEEPLRNDEATTLTNQGFGNPISGSNLTNNAFGNYVEGSDLTNQTFGSPIGNGIIVMLIAGASYAALKTNKKNNKK